jgi:type I restriction enzyme S subunit
MKEGKLPKGWRIIELGNVLSLEYGKSLPKKERSGIGFPVMGSNGEIDQHSEYLVEGPGIVVGRKGSHGEVVWVESNFFPIDTTYYVKTKPEIDLRYSFYFLKKSDLKSLNRSTAIPGLNRNDAYKIRIDLPPLPEQQRIVAKLDALFGHLDSLREKLDRIPGLLKNFRQQVLTQAVTGKLTKEWREKVLRFKELDHLEDEDFEIREIKYGIPETWNWLPFSRVAEVKSNLVQPNDFLEKPLIAPDNIESGTGKLISKPLVNEILPKSPKHYFEEGNIVYSKIRPYLSKLIIADFDGLCSADMYPISTSLNIKYLYYYMLSNVFLRYATTAGERSVLPKINQKELGIIPISVPSKLEQQEIVKTIDVLFELADKIDSQYQSLKAKIEQLPQAILAKAFRGELVEQEGVKWYEVGGSERLMAAEEGEADYSDNKSM